MVYYHLCGNNSGGIGIFEMDEAWPPSPGAVVKNIYSCKGVLIKKGPSPISANAIYQLMYKNSHTSLYDAMASCKQLGQEHLAAVALAELSGGGRRRNKRRKSKRRKSKTRKSKTRRRRR